MQLERSADQSTSERDTFQRNIDLILTENLHLKSQAKLDFEAQLKEFEKQLTVLEQSNHELSDRLVVVEMERAELAAALDSTRHKNSKSSTSVHPQSLSAGLPGDNAGERDSVRAQLVQAQQKNAGLELDLANMKQRLLVPFENIKTGENTKTDSQHENHHVAKIALLESDLAQLRAEHKKSLLSSRLSDAQHAEHEVLRELLGATRDAGPIEQLQCLQWELQNARSQLEAYQSSTSLTLNVDLQKLKAALAESLAERESASENARVVFEGMNALLSKVASSKQPYSATTTDAAAADCRLPWLKSLQKLLPPTSSSLVDSMVSTLTRLSNDEEIVSDSALLNDDTEARILKFKLRAMAAQLSRAEKCLLESSPSSLKVQAETLTSRNIFLENKITDAETSIKTLAADRDDCAKRYSSLLSSFSQLSSLNNHIVREVVTLRRKLKAEQAGASAHTEHSEGPRDFDREVEEAASAFSSSFNQVVLDAVDREAFRSAKKRTIMQEQNELIISLRSELSDLKRANAELQMQLQDALQAPKLMAVLAQQQQQHVINVPALYPSAFLRDEASNFTDRTAEEEFLTIRLKASARPYYPFANCPHPLLLLADSGGSCHVSSCAGRRVCRSS